jgi:hypothetical protein
MSGITSINCLRSETFLWLPRRLEGERKNADFPLTRESRKTADGIAFRLLPL